MAVSPHDDPCLRGVRLDTLRYTGLATDVRCECLDSKAQSPKWLTPSSVRSPHRTSPMKVRTGTADRLESDHSRVTVSSSTARLLALDSDPPTLSRRPARRPLLCPRFRRGLSTLSVRGSAWIVALLAPPRAEDGRRCRDAARHDRVSPFTRCRAMSLAVVPDVSPHRCGLARRTSVALGSRLLDCWKTTSHPCK
jgi:hypothetical protein